MNSNRIFILLSRKVACEANISELAELDDLLKSYPEQKLPIELIEEFWNTASEKDRDFLEATYYLHLNRLKEHGFDLTETQTSSHGTDSDIEVAPASLKHKHLKKLLAASTLLIIVATVFCIIISVDKKTITSGKTDIAKIDQSEVSTKNGSRTKIQLPDGTSVWLNGGSKLVYNNEQYGRLIREVTLTGEGYFDVIKNPEKPFIIHTNRMDIKVLGTVFNVRCYPDEKNTETSLIRGSIEVTLKSRKEKIMLKPSEKLIISDELAAIPVKAIKTPDQIILLRHLTVLPKDSTIAETAWVENRLVFSSESFEEVALKMEKWYSVEIMFANEKLKLYRLTGSFERETISEALKAIQISTPFFKYKINRQHISIFK